MLAALVPPVRGEVKEIPDVGGPEVGPRLDHPEHVLVIERLVFLGVVALFGMGGMEGGVCVRAVLGKADHTVGVLGVILVKKLVRLLQLAEIPAEVEVIAVDVGDLQNGALGLQHENVGHGGQTRWIHAVAELVEQPVILQQILVDRAGGGDLVGEAPDGDRGVVIALGD